MADAHYLSDKDGEKFYPYAHVSATYDNNGNTVEKRLKALDETASSAVQSVKIGTTEYKSGTTVTLPSYPTSLPASDVSAWAKASTKPSYTKSEVGLGNVDNTADENKNVKSSTKLQTYKQGSTTETYGNSYPVYAQWTDSSHVKMKCDNYTVETDYATSAGSATNASKVNNHTVESDVPANAKFTDTTYSSKAATSGGTDVSLVTTGEKANWNAKTSNTGTITGIKMNGASKGTSGVVDLGTVLTGGKQSTTSTADGGANVYTFSDGSTITVKNGSKGSTGATGSPGAAGKNGSNGTSAAWFSGTAVTGTSTSAVSVSVSGSKTGDMYLNTSTANVYRASAANSWVYVCNIKGATGAQGARGATGTNGSNGVTPTIKVASGSAIGSVGTPSVTASTSGTTTTFTFNYLKGTKGDKGDAGVNATTTAVATTNANGLMSKDMVTKLNGIASGATAVTSTTVSNWGFKKTDTNTWRPLGTTADTACAGNDSRLNNARPANGGTATYANYVYATSHQGSWYQNSQWDGTYFQTNYKNGDNVLPMKVNNAGYADSAGSANSVAWSNVSGRPSSMPASDVYSWAKASSKPSYTASEVGAAAANHSHSNYLTGITKSMVTSALGYTPIRVIVQSSEPAISTNDEWLLEY
mgnify:CR=1 FL=1